MRVTALLSAILLLCTTSLSIADSDKKAQKRLDDLEDRIANYETRLKNSPLRDLGISFVSKGQLNLFGAEAPTRAPTQEEIDEREEMDNSN